MLKQSGKNPAGWGRGEVGGGIPFLVLGKLSGCG